MMKIKSMYVMVVLVMIVGVGGWSLPGEAETFRVGLMQGGFPPMFFDDGDERTGLYIDILQEICQITGDSIEKRYAPTARIKKWFEEGDVDIEPGVSPLWRSDQASISAYTTPFMKYTTAVIMRKDAAFPVETVADLKEKRIGVIRGYKYPGWESEEYTRDEAMNDERLFAKLREGRYDMCFAGELISQYYAREMGIDIVIAKPMYTLDISYRLHIDKADAVERFNAALETLRENGTIERLINTYIQ